jgi:hypothetical protein
VGIPNNQIGRLVGDDGQKVAVLVPPEAGAHARQRDLGDKGEGVTIGHSLLQLFL